MLKYKIAGIVSYNPDLSRLNKNISSIISQVDHVIIVDNNSENIESIKKSISAYNNIEIISNNKNFGIAKALNQICKRAKRLGYEWCLLLDQDSVCSDNIINEYSKHLGMYNCAMFCPFIVDEFRTSLNKYKSLDLCDKSLCSYAITSGSFVNLLVWEEVGGFFEDLFIDAVDTDYSYNLRSHGYTIYRINSCYILHEQGNNVSKTHIYLYRKDLTGERSFRPIYRSNYSEMRRYYISRNNIIVGKKYKELNGSFKAKLINFFSAILVVIIEKNKLKTISAIISGCKDGKKYTVEKVPITKGSIKLTRDRQ